MKLTEVSSRIFTPQHLLVYGDPSTGKSTLVSKLAEDGRWNLKWLSLDNGHSVLLKLTAAAQERVELFNIPDTRGYPVGVDAVRRLLDRKPCHFCDLHGKNDCSVCAKAQAGFSDLDVNALKATDILVLDNLSQLSDSTMALIVKNKEIDYKLQLDDWGSLRFHLVKYLTDIQQLPCNLVCIAHAVEEELVDKNKKVMPAVGSSTFAPKVAGYFDHVVFCRVFNNKHRYGSSSTYLPSIITKSRTDIEIEKMPVESLVPFFDGTIGSTAPSTSEVVRTLQTAAAKAATLQLGGATK